MDRDDEAKKFQDLKAKIQRANEDIATGNTVDGETFFQDKLGIEDVSDSDTPLTNVKQSNL